MDNTIRNVSELEEALSKMKRPSNIDTRSNSAVSTPILTPHNSQSVKMEEDDDSANYSTPQNGQEQHKPISRTSVGQFGSAGLLQNMAALQTSTNLKLDKLTDAIYALNNSVRQIVTEQKRQTELLSDIARNTVAISSISINSNSQSSSTKNTDLSIKNYGFNTNHQLLSEFIMKIITQVQSQAVAKSRQYRATREFTLSHLRRVISMAMKNKFKINGNITDEIEAKGTKLSSFIKVASRIGSVDDSTPVLTAQALREIFDDHECGVFVRIVESIMERLYVLRILIPHYEADIIAALEFPYFGREGDAICDWSKISPRNERENEATAFKADPKSQEKLAKLLAIGTSERAAISAIIQRA